MTYKAIGFDWGGVLSGRPGRFFGESISKHLGITHDEYREAYFRYNGDFNRGDITADELWSRVLGELGKLDKRDSTLALIADLRKDDINQDVVELVDTLHANGYKVGLLSNNTKENGDKMRAAGYDSHFDVFHISAETGLVKPDADAYEYFAKGLGVEASELIFIDDTQKSLSTADEVGYTPVVFDNYDQLVDELKRLGVTI